MPPLQLDKEPNNTIATADTLSLATSGNSQVANVAGTILTPSDLNYFNLGTIQAGYSVLISSQLPSTSLLTPVVSVYNANDVYLNKTNGRPFDGVGQFDITQTGTYYALMQGGSATGGVIDQYLMNIQIVPTSSLAALPNLEVTSISLPSASNIQSGQQITFGWTVTNEGQAPTNVANWSDRAVISLDTTYGNSDDIPLGTSDGIFGHSGILGIGQSYTATETITLPDGISGNYYIILQTDTNDQVDENAIGRGDSITVSSGGSNNNGTFTVNLAPYADLLVQGLTVNGPNAAGTFTVSWNTVNQGNGAVASNWSEQLVVKDVTTGVTVVNAPLSFSGGLAANGGTAAHTEPLSGSYGVDSAGHFQVTVTTNANQGIYEDNAQGHANAVANDTSSTAFDASRDLTVTNLAVSSPANPQSGNLVTLNWKDTNTGILATSGGWNDHVTVVNSTLGTTLYSANIAYTGTAIAPGSASGTLSTSFTLPDGGPGVGTITVTVTVNSNSAESEYNAAGTAGNNDNSLIGFTSTLANYADLVVASGSLSVTPGSPLSGGAVTVKWQDKNQGDGAVSSAFQDYVLVQKVNANQTLTNITSGFVTGNSSLAAGATSAQQQFMFTLPDGVTGTGDIRVTVTTDIGQTIKEYDSNGNTAYGNNSSSTDVTSTLANYADLIVLAGSLSVTPTSPQSGGMVTVTWNDKNQGDAAVNGAFNDTVLVQKVNADQSLTYITQGSVAGNSSLGIGATSGQQQFAFTLPNGTAGTGDIRVTVTTDGGQTIKEYDSSGNAAYSNNSASSDVTSTLARYADLIVAPGSLAITPGGLQSGNSATVSWSDENQGNAATGGSYLDYVLVQRVNLDNTLTYIASGLVSGPNPLAAGATGAQESFGFTLPDGAAGSGNFRATVTTDYYQSIPEFDGSGNAAYGNNSLSTTTSSTLASYADLVVASNSLSVTPSNPQSGGSLTASWMDKNQGNAAVNAAFSDYVLVQKVNTDQTLSYITSGYVAGNASLAAGATSGVQSFPFTLPNGTPGTGDIRVTVTTDTGHTVKEYDSSGNSAYGNNSSSTDATSTLAPSPDLVVQNIVVNGGSASQVLPNQTIPVTWNDSNQGTVAASGTWLDQVFLASDSAGTQNLQLLQTVSASANLASSGALARSTMITIPATDVGKKYVVVETGLSESFFEFNTTNNTTVSSSAITIPPSVQVSLAAPGNRTFSKGTVNPASTATVTRNDTNVGSLSVTITSSNPAAVLIAANPGDTPAASINVVIPSGAFSAVFYVDAVQDNFVDGTQMSTITPSANGYVSMADTATELESNNPALSLSLASSTFADNSGTMATLSRNTNSSSALDAALVVAIASSDPSVATAPATVTIPADQSSVSFPITGVATTLLVDTRSVIFTTNTPVDPVSGRNFAASAAAATITDTNTPVLELATDAPYVEDNAANPATYATLSLTDGHGNPMPLASAITVALSSNDNADLSLPSNVTVAAGVTSVRIPLSVVNNPNNNNPVVTLAAYALDAITSRPINTGHATTTLSVLSTSGASLAITAPTFIGVTAGSAMATLSLGNTPLASDLTVSLSSSNTGEATVPATVVIPAGATSAPFEISVPSGATALPVTITAATAGYNMAAATVNIVTASIPDLALTSITAPASPQAGEFNVSLSWKVTNDGNGTATGLWNDHVVISTDPAGNNVVFSTNIAFAGGSLTEGSSYTGTTKFNVPPQVGIYYVSVTTNYGANAIPEITTSNDSKSTAMNVGVAYYATLGVQANPKQVSAGSPLSVAGTVTDVDGVTHPVGAIVYIAVYKNGKSMEQDGPIFANPNGTYSYTFAPSSTIPGDHYLTAGDYQFFALTNGQTPQQVPTQSTDTASVLGMSILPSPISMNLVPGTPLAGTVTLTNQSSVPLTNLVVTKVDEGSGSQLLPISASIVINNPAVLPGTTTTPGQLTASYTLTATQSIAVSGRIFVTFNDDQNTPVTIELDPTITPPTPRLTATSIKAGVVVGTDTLVSFTLTNSGSASSGPLTIITPVDWITVASLPTALAPGSRSRCRCN